MKQFVPVFDTKEDLIRINKVISEKQSWDKRVLYEKYIEMYHITKEFIKEKNLILYGGTALNMALPKNLRFYDNYELPDYDFFSYDAKNHAKELADIYAAKCYKFVEVRPGIHNETYKVYVDFQPVADITDIPQRLFIDLLETSMEERPTILKKNPSLDMNIAPLSFLRLAFHIELSRPEGFIERWPKIYSRMALFYSTYPLNFEPCPDIFVPEPRTRIFELAQVALNYCKTHMLPIMGLEAIKMYLKYHGTEIEDNVIVDKGMALLEVISLDYERTVESIKLLLSSMLEKDEKLTVTHHAPLNKSELIPRHYVISLDSHNLGIMKRPLVVVYSSHACYSYKELDGINVLSIDSMLSLMYAYTFSHRDYFEVSKVKCLINMLLNLQYKHLHSKKYVWRRFDLLCYGIQPKIEDVKKQRWGSKKTFQIYRPEIKPKAPPKKI